MTAERKALEEAIGHLYLTFAKYPLRKDTEACSCCHDEPEELRIHSKSLRQLNAEDLDSYAWDALLTWGNVEDFKHFLPRMFELVADAHSGLADTSVVMAKLRYANWQEWPDGERCATATYLQAMWRRFLTDIDFARLCDDLLCGIAQAADDLSWFLDEWYASDLVGHYLLARFFAEEAGSIAGKRELTNPFWRDRPDQAQQVVDWLLSPATKDEIELAYLGHPSDPLAVDIVAALETIETALPSSRAQGGGSTSSSYES